MKPHDNTIFIACGGFGLGRGLAEALHRLGNQVIISGRCKAHLDEATKANPGMKSVEWDVTNPAGIHKVAAKLTAEFPKLNVLINTTGVMRCDDFGVSGRETLRVSTVSTNLLAPIRMTGALINHLKKQDKAFVINISAVLGVAPLAMTGVYSTTKAVIDYYSVSLRYQLKDTWVRVLEIPPQLVQTHPLNLKNEPPTTPLQDIISEIMTILSTETPEVIVDRTNRLRITPAPNEAEFAAKFNDLVSEPV